MGAGCSALDDARRQANAGFALGDYETALESYSVILEKVEDAKVYSNRCATYLHLNKPRLAFLDALKVIALQPEWHKGYFRLGCSLVQLDAPSAALLAFALCPAQDATVQARKEEAVACAVPQPWRGNAYAWGDADGLAVLPKAIPELKGSLIVDCGAGMAHTVAVTQEGHVFTWGLNVTKQCGIEEDRSDEIPSPRVALLGQKVIAVACGAGHTVCLTEDGRALGWGLGANGQLGGGSLVKDNLCVVVGAGEKKKWHGVACGFAHTMLVDKDKDLYGCGWNVEGQVGTNDGVVQSRAGNCIPSLRRILRNVTHVSCGGAHTVAVATDGSVQAWGANQCGQVGNGSTDSIFVPQPSTCTFPRNSTGEEVCAVLVTCGEEFTFAISANRHVFAWGLNNVKQLLLDEYCVFAPTMVDALADRKIEWILSSQGSSLALAEDGTMWKWGNHAPSPARFAGIRNVALVKCGRRHYVAALVVPRADHSFLVLKNPGSFRVKQRIDVALSMDSKPVLGLPLTYFVLNLDTQHRDASIVDLWEDTLTIIPKDAGFVELHVLLGLTPVKNSPLLLEVQAGEVDVDHCHCTLKPFASIPVGETLIFYVILKDSLGNYCVGTAQNVSVKAPNSPHLKVEDVENGTSRVSMCWTRMGVNQVSVYVTKNGILHVLKESEIEVTPGLAWAPEWVEDAPRTAWKQMAGTSFAAAFELRDRFGNMTEHVGDAAVCVEGSRVALEFAPQRTLDPYAPWKPPVKEHCVLKFELELLKVGTYNVVWTTHGGHASKELVIEHGPPHPYRCRVQGILNMLVPDPNVSQAWTLGCFDAYDNPCVLGASTVRITVEKWPGGEPVSLELKQNKHIYACTASFTDYGEYHIFAWVDGIKVLGCPFSMTVTEDPREAEKRRQAALEEAERLEAERQRMETEMAQQKNDKDKVAAGLAERKKKKDEDAEMAALEAKRKELEKARREARVREMAVAALRKVQAEMLEKRREKKEKRVGGGFVVKFESRERDKPSKEDNA